MKKDSYVGQSAQLPESMNKLVLGLATTSVALLTPFTMNSFLQGHNLIGIASVAIVAIFAFSAWSIIRHQRYYPLLILFGLVPSILFFLIVLLRNQGIVGVLWCYPSILSFYFLLPERKAWLANAALLIITMPFIWAAFDPALFIRIAATLGLVSLFSAIFINVIAEQQKKLQDQAFTDPLTGVLNRTLLHDMLQQAIEQHNRTQIPMTIATLDLDHFKNINDELGHDAGDTVLRDIGNLLLQRCRSVDKVFRLGGEEFLIFLYDTDLETGQHVTEEIRSMIESLQTFPSLTVTTSAGLATLRSDESWQQWMKRSDKKLYQAKENGRNCVMA